jgi:hypothetical protein
MNSIKLFVMVLSAALLIACAGGGGSLSGDSGVTETNSKQLTGDLPLPPGATIKQQETLVMGTGSSWIGRVSLSIAGEPQAIFTYFRDTLPGSGWALTSSSFSKLSLLTFTKAERVANVQIQNGSFRNNDVLITVSPTTRSGSARP